MIEPLSHKNSLKLLEFLHDLYELRTKNALSDHLVSALPSMVPADVTSYNDIDTSNGTGSFKTGPEEFRMSRESGEVLARYAHQHPILSHMERTKDGCTRKLSDFMTMREFRRTTLFNEFYHPLRIPYIIGMALSLNRHHSVTIARHRNGREFVEQDRTMLEVARPHLLQAFRNAQAVSRMQEELSTLRQSLEEVKQAVLAITLPGRVTWASARAQAILQEHWGVAARSGSRLPSDLIEWIKSHETHFRDSAILSHSIEPLVMERPASRITVRLVRDGAQRLLLLQEELFAFPVERLNTLGLSSRETEVLGWIAQGKSNPEIALILHISVRTVHKHIERLYAKLGVENRHAAMTVASQAIRS